MRSQMPPDIHQDPEPRRLRQYYAGLCCAVLLHFVPLINVQVVAGVLFLVLFAGAYVLRARHETEGLMDNHMTYIIRTIWLFGAIMLVGGVLGGMYMSTYADMGPVNDMLARMQQGITYNAPEMMNVIYNFLTLNGQHTLVAAGLAIGPAALYLIYRLAGGLERALKGYRIANPRSVL